MGRGNEKMNDIIRSSSLEVAKYHQQELIRRAEHKRLIAEAKGSLNLGPIAVLRLSVGRAIVAMGRRVQGGNACLAEEVNASPALKLAR